MNRCGPRHAVQRRVIRGAALSAALVLSSGAAVAQAGEPARDETRGELEERIASHDADTERRVLGLWGAGVSEEQVLSASVGLVVTDLPSSFDCSTTCQYTGFYAKIEPGLGAGKLSVGRADLVGEQRGSARFVRHVFFGWGVRASVMRTWSDRSSEPPGQTWLGVEADVTAVMVRFNLGLFRHVSGDAEDDWLVSAGIGVGF